MIGIRNIHDHQLIFPAALCIVLGFSFFQSHETLDLEGLRQELAQEKKDQSGMDQEQSDFPLGKREPFYMRCDQVDQQYSSQQIAARPNRHFPTGAWWVPENKETVKITRLCDVESQVHLGQ